MGNEASSQIARETSKAGERNDLRTSEKTPDQEEEEEEDKEYQAEVDKHNKEFAEGSGTPPETAAEDKVDERFWKGAQHIYSQVLISIAGTTN